MSDIATHSHDTQPRLKFHEQSPELVKKLVDFSMAITNSGHSIP